MGIPNFLVLLLAHCPVLTAEESCNHCFIFTQFTGRRVADRAEGQNKKGNKMSTELLNRLDCSRKDQKMRNKMDMLVIMSDMDTMFPIPTALSRHDCSSQNYKRSVKKKMDRRGRFRTQPITFMEIKVRNEVEKK